MFIDQQDKLQFIFIPDVAIYMPGCTIPTLVRGHGKLDLLFKQTKNPDMLAVNIVDMRVRLSPFILPIDINGKGQKHCLEVNNITIDSRFLNLKESKGSLNLKTGDFELTFMYVITPDAVPMMQNIAGKAMSFTVNDRGKMDFKKGTFEIHSPVIIEIKEGPLAGAKIRGGGTGTLGGPPPPPDSTIDLNIVILTPGASRCGNVSQNNVTICPGDQVMLCWEASDDVVSVDIDPGPAGQPRTGVFVDTPSASVPQTVYRAKTVGGNTEAEDTVTATMYRPGEWMGPYLAEADGMAWSLDIPPTLISGRIEVHEVLVDSGAGCLDWTRYFLEHIPTPAPAGPGGGPDFGGTITAGAPEAIPEAARFMAAGLWRFTTSVDPPHVPPYPRINEVDPLCFRFQGACTPA